MAELLNYIMKNVNHECYTDLPIAWLHDETENYAEFDKILRCSVGKPILTLEKLKAASVLSDKPRSLAIRALMGGLPKASIKQAHLSCTPRAVIVYANLVALWFLSFYCFGLLAVAKAKRDL